MRKGLSILTTIALFALIFTSCDDVSSDLAPEISVTPVADTIDVFIGDSIEFSVTLSSENTLSTFKTLVATTGVTLTNGIVNYTSETSDAIDVVATITDAVADSTVIEFSFVVTDEDKQSSVKKYVLAKAKTTPLAEAADFTWKRVGGAAAEGLEMFGLVWESNSATSAIIKKDADKFVKLDSMAWTDIATKEALIEAIDAAENIDQYEDISAEASMSQDITLGTVKEGVYYLIHISNSSVTTDATIGTTITIIGMYKI